MTERERKEIEAYLPGTPDPTLEAGEYYYLQSTTGGDRVIRVFALDVLPHKDGTEYGIYQQRGGRLVWVDGGGWGDPTRGARMHDLYDNKDDCRNCSHWFMDDWERLRAIQREEQHLADHPDRP